MPPEKTYILYTVENIRIFQEGGYAVEYKYTLIKSTLLSGDNCRVCYGIAVEEEQDGVSVILQSVSDIAVCSDRLEQLVDLCNELELDPIHLNDVVDDYLASL